MRNKKLIIKKDYEAISDYAVTLFESIISNTNKKIVNIALSGGNTPKLMFDKLSKSTIINWDYVNIFIVDERHVENTHKDSNSKLIKEILINKIDIPKRNIHFVKYFNDPSKSLKNYREDIRSHFKLENKLQTPKFDLIHLGIGTDGHTASIFPNQNIDHNKLLDITKGSKYKRITFTYRILNNAENIMFLVSGKEKAEIVGKLFNSKEDIPASHVNSNDKIYYLLDTNATIDI
jgi:6-phosphogluconolactonase